LFTPQTATYISMVQLASSIPQLAFFIQSQTCSTLGHSALAGFSLQTQTLNTLLRLHLTAHSTWPFTPTTRSYEQHLQRDSNRQLDERIRHRPNDPQYLFNPSNLANVTYSNASAIAQRVNLTASNLAHVITNYLRLGSTGWSENSTYGPHYCTTLWGTEPYYQVM
jgi:hypothetical protein